MAVEPQKRGHILYIDDSPAELATAATALRQAGYGVTSSTGVRGVERALERADIVLIDYHMPGMNGGEVLEHLRGLTGLVSNNPDYYLYTSDKDVGSDYREHGFDGRLILKGNSEALLRQVSSALRIRKLRHLRAS